MFHRVTDASKVALVGLVDLLCDDHADQRVLDVQWRTDHLGSLGVVEVPRGRTCGCSARRWTSRPRPLALRRQGREASRRQSYGGGGHTTCGVWWFPLTIARPAANQSTIPPRRLTASSPRAWR